MITCAVCGYLHVSDLDSSLCAVEIVLFGQKIDSVAKSPGFH